MTDLLKNFAYCQLTADVDNVTTTFSVDETSRLPANADMAAPSQFWMTVESTYAAGTFEIVQVTHKSTDSGAGDLTVVRAQESTTATAHTSGTFLKGALTALMTQNIYDAATNAKFVSEYRADWASATAYPYGSLVRFKGGLYVANGDIPSWEKDPLTPSDPQDTASPILFGNGSTAGQAALGAATDRIAQGFKLNADATITSVLVESLAGFPSGAGVKVGIASSLGGGTPTFLTSVDAPTPPDVSNPGITSFQVLFPSPVALTAGTQYYVVLIGDAGDTSVVGACMYQPASGMTLTNGPGALTDATYDCFYDSTFSTNLNTTAGTTARMWMIVYDGVSNDWIEVLPPPVLLTDTLPTADAAHEGQIVVVQTPSAASVAHICLLGSDGVTYSWVTFATGP